MPPSGAGTTQVSKDGGVMPSKSANVKNEKQYEALKDKGMSKQRAAKIANAPDASTKGASPAAAERRTATAAKAGPPPRRRRRAARG